MTVICAWCNKTLGEQPGDGVSHGICPTCAERMLAEYAASQERRAKSAEGNTDNVDRHGH